MSADQTPAIDWDTHEPTGAVHRAAIVLSSADSVDATCFGWVPQAHEALAAALDVTEMAVALFAHEYPGRFWGDAPEWMQANYTERATSLRAAILGADS